MARAAAWPPHAGRAAAVGARADRGRLLAPLSGHDGRRTGDDTRRGQTHLSRFSAGHHARRDGAGDADTAHQSRLGVLRGPAAERPRRGRVVHTQIRRQRVHRHSEKVSRGAFVTTLVQPHLLHPRTLESRTAGGRAGSDLIGPGRRLPFWVAIVTQLTELLSRGTYVP